MVIPIATVAAVAAGTVATGAPSAPRPAPASPPAAQVLTCDTGAQPAARSALFSASMSALPRTQRMGMRFRLWQRHGAHGAFAAIDVPAWVGWQKSDPARPAFVLIKRVGPLPAPGVYRAQVTFRWYDIQGRVQREVTRTTAACSQPEPSVVPPAP